MCITCKSCGLRQVCAGWLHGKGHDYVETVYECYACPIDEKVKDEEK